jgi:hypothetical protein
MYELPADRVDSKDGVAGEEDYFRIIHGQSPFHQ